MSMWVHPRISPQALRKAEDESLVGLLSLDGRGHAEVFSKENFNGISTLCSRHWRP